MSALSLADALAALETVAREAGVDPAAARREGEALSATVSERSRGAFVAWCAETGREKSAEEHAVAAKQGNRFRGGPTPTMAALQHSRSSHVDAYWDALNEVAAVALTLGEPGEAAAGAAQVVMAAQRGATTMPPVVTNEREPVPGVGSHLVTRVLEELGEVQRKLTNMDLVDVPPETPGAFPLEGLEGREEQKDPTQVAPTEPPKEEEKPEEPTEPEPPPKSVDELLAELDELVGLTAVKAEIHRQAAVLRVEGLRKDAGLAAPTITRHMIFNGNPGTGKTTVARLVAGIYRALGLLSKGQLVEVDRSEMVAGYLGQTAMKTAELVKSAEGGVLFIDEAYSLSGDQYGTEAIDTLVKEMEDKRDDLVVIVAGYPVPMAVFISQNPGLESRFRTQIDFVDYTDDELVQIFEVLAKGAEYDVDQGVLDRLRQLLAAQERGPTFGNARYVRNVLEAAIGRHAWRLREIDKPTVEQLRQLTADDLDTVEEAGVGPTEPVEWEPNPVEGDDQTTEATT
jgi:adenylate kinase family enzyme